MILAVSVMATVVMSLKWLLPLTGGGLPESANLAILVTTGALTYSGALWLLDRPFVLQTKSLLMRAMLS